MRRLLNEAYQIMIKYLGRIICNLAHMQCTAQELL